MGIPNLPQTTEPRPACAHLCPVCDWEVAYLRKAGEAKERRIQDLQAMEQAKLSKLGLVSLFSPALCIG